MAKKKKKKQQSGSNILWWGLVLAAALFSFFVRMPLTPESVLSSSVAVLSVMVFFILGRAVLYDEKKAVFAAVVLLTAHGMLLMGRNSSAVLSMAAAAAALAGGLFFILSFSDAKSGGWIMTLGGLLSGAAFCLGGFSLLSGVTLPLLLAYLLIWRPSLKGRVWQFILSIVAGAAAVLVYAMWLHWFDSLSVDKILSMWKFAPSSLSWSSFASIGEWLGIWTVPAIVVLFAPLYSAPERGSVEYRFLCVWTLLSLAGALFFRYPAALLFPCALMTGYVAMSWMDAPRKKSGDETSIAIIVLALAVAAAVAYISWRTWQVHSASMSVTSLTILLISAAAVCVYVLASAFRRGSADIVAGAGLFFMIYEILVRPSLWMI